MRKKPDIVAIQLSIAKQSARRAHVILIHTSLQRGVTVECDSEEPFFNGLSEKPLKTVP
jgi:hypothetical protein